MKPSKSVNSLSNQPQQQQQQQQQAHLTNGHTMSRRAQPEQRQEAGSAAAPTSPICRCRVMYLGSSVPHETKDGLQGIQQPLRELYPDRTSLSQGNAGIDSWLSVWSNGILIENVDETGREVKKFFKIEALHYCAAVKFVPQTPPVGPNQAATATLAHHLAGLPKFLPLDSPHARLQQDTSTSPPIFASILRRTTGVKVLECHAFICKREAAANALVRCCFHAYADTMYAKQIGAEIENRAPGREAPRQPANGYAGAPAVAARRSKSIAALNDVGDGGGGGGGGSGGEYSDSSQRRDFQGAVLRRRSLNNGQQQLNYADGCDSAGDPSQRHQQLAQEPASLQSQKFSSKSMHHLNQAHLDRSFSNFLQQGTLGAQSTSYHNLARGKPADEGADPSLPFPHNPYASRVPSYPPQNIIDQQQQQQQMQMQANGGTLRSVKSMAANSIASTLLRSKKHAKAMSMAQLSSQQRQLAAQPPVTSFHQLAQQAHEGSLYGGSFMTLPPVPPMFLPNVPRHINGSQTMKLPSRHLIAARMAAPGPPNFEAMTPKEMKKLLKKSAKFGLEPGRFADNGLPLMPLGPMPMFGLGHQGGTLNSTAMLPLGETPHNLPDHLTPHPFGPPVQMFLPPPPPGPDHLMDPSGCGPPQPIKSILVKPSPEFLKSKAGKKWLKQQKEFKKLLPSHLDGLPIVFGPPPVDMLDPAGVQGPISAASSANSTLAPPPRPPFLHPPPSLLPPPPPPGSSASQAGLPVLDSNGFYNPHPLYGPSGRASAASTLLRNSPQMMHHHHHQQVHDDQLDYQLMMQHRHHQSLYSNPMLVPGQQLYQPAPPPPPPTVPPHLQAADETLYGGRSMGHQFGPSSARRRRNHMVEQSVISLGDEENEADEDQDERAAADESEEADGSEGQSTNGYYNQLDNNGAAALQPRRRNGPTSDQQHTHHLGSEQHLMAGYQDDYEQLIGQQQQYQAGSDDRASNSSGINRRRNHINERAFSYSIRQEASKSSADNSDAEYRNGELSDSNYQSSGSNNNHIKYRPGQQPMMSQPHQRHRPQMTQYDEPRHQGNSYQAQQQYYSQQHSRQQQPVDDLSARLENQLNMKSFANSCVKSHM